MTYTGFEERLLHVLKEHVAQQPAAVPNGAPAPQHRTRVVRRATGALAMGLAASAAAVLVSGQGHSEGKVADTAYSISGVGGGDIRVVVGDVFAAPDVPHLQRDLNRLGAPARAYTADPHCPTPASVPLYNATVYDPAKSEQDNLLDATGFAPAAEHGKEVWYIRPSAVPHGSTLTFTFLPNQHQATGGQMRFAMVKGQGPACEPFVGPPGMPSITVVHR